MDLPHLLRRLQDEDVVVQPRRLSILILLALEGNKSFRELQEMLGMSPGNLGSHLKVLEGKGLIRRTRCLRTLRYVTCYEITDEGVEKLASVLNLASRISKIIDAGRDDGSRGLEPPEP